MNGKRIEDLMIASLDDTLSPGDQAFLNRHLESDPEAKKIYNEHLRVRGLLKKRTALTFGPLFSEMVIRQIADARVAIDRWIFIFFKKFQLAAAGIIVALVILNLYFESGNNAVITSAEEVSEDVFSIDFMNTLIESI